MKIKTSMKITTRSPSKNFFAIFKKEAILQANKFLQDFAQDLLEEAQDIVRNQSYDWEPLSEDYRAFKEREGLDPRILIATEDYVSSFRWWVTEGGRIHFGPGPGTHLPSGLPYKVLAMIHEFGTETVPARPLWRPLLAAALRKSEKFKKAYGEAVRKAAEKAASGSKTETKRS